MTQVKCPNCGKFYLSRQKKRFKCKHCGYRWTKAGTDTGFKPPDSNQEPDKIAEAEIGTEQVENAQITEKGIKIEQKKILEEPRMGEDDKKDAEAEFECGACGAEWGR